MNSININLKSLIHNEFISNQSIDEFLKDHNDMCNTINDYNKFWKNIFQILVLSLIPANLLNLQQLLFEKMPNNTLIALVNFLIFTLTLLYICNTLTALVSKQVLKSYVLINKLLLKLKSNHSIRRRIKVMFIFQNNYFYDF